MENYIEINKASWNARTAFHVDSDFYDMPSFLKGKSSLNSIELDLLGDIAGKRLLHLQCHFGQDSISLSKMGAKVTGVDLSDKAIDEARNLAKKMDADTSFVCCDVHDLPAHLEGEFDIVFTSYGVIGWLPDLNKWASIIDHFLAPKGKLLLVEFHPMVWMFDDDFNHIKYSYFNEAPIVEFESGTYANRDADMNKTCITWNHPTSDVLTSLLEKGLTLKTFKEYNYAPYNCFNDTIEFAPGKYRIAEIGDKMPMVFALLAEK